MLKLGESRGEERIVFYVREWKGRLTCISLVGHGLVELIGTCEIHSNNTNFF